MKKPTRIAPVRNQNIAARRIAPLVEQVRALVHAARREVASNVNALQVRTNFEIGRLIVEHEQRGRRRADYGEETLVHLSASLSAEFGRGFSRANLEYMRKFYLLWQDRPGLISQTASGKLPAAEIRQTVSAKSPAGIAQKISAQRRATSPSPSAR